MLIESGQRRTLAEAVWDLFVPKPYRTQVAALPWRFGRKGVEILLVTSRDAGRWVLPKGWPERGETFWDAAAREAGEEAGVSGEISPREIGSYSFEKRKAGAERRYLVHVFAMEIDTVRDKWPERKQRERAWYPAAEAANLMREAGLAELILRFAHQPREWLASTAET